MKKVIIAVISVWFVFIIQSSIFSQLNIGGIVPNLLLILTATWGFMGGERYGLAVGFACGMLMDIFFGSFIGMHAVFYMYIGYANGKFCNLFYPEDIKLPIILTAASDLAYGFLCYVFFYLLRGRFDFGYYFLHIILPEIIATLLAALAQYPITLLVYNRFFAEKR